MRTINRLVVGLIITVTAASDVTAQEGWRWSVVGGPTFAPNSGRFFQPGSNGITFSQSEPIVTGADHGVLHLGLDASRTIPGSSLRFRSQLLYNRRGSSPRSWTGDDPLWQPRPALRDEAYMISTGLDWDALPTKSWSPYLLTSVGLMQSRLSWSRDPRSNRFDETTVSHGPFVGYGTGLRIRAGQREYFAEWRRHHTWNVYGADVAPFSFGIRF